MFTNKDINYKSLFVVNGLEHRKLKVSNFRLALENTEINKIETAIPFNKILALFVIGHTTITTPLIDRCSKHAIPLVVMNSRLRPLFCHSLVAEGNYLLREKQYQLPKEDMKIPKILVTNKLNNQLMLLNKTKRKDSPTHRAIEKCKDNLSKIPIATDINSLMGLEGGVAKLFFTSYFQDYDWKCRMPRTKICPLNTLLDIGYTMLFNYIESMLKLFGFDTYKGVYHQLWFRRKSLVCDIIEPFRCLVEQEIRKSLNYGRFSLGDFEIKNGRYYLAQEVQKQYITILLKNIIAHKNEIFIYIRDYYRCFMQRKSVQEFPQFKLN